MQEDLAEIIQDLQGMAEEISGDVIHPEDDMTLVLDSLELVDLAMTVEEEYRIEIENEEVEDFKRIVDWAEVVFDHVQKT